MPDYDPKSIPILDDIIDNEVDSEVDSENTDAADTAYTKPLSEEANTDIPGTEDGSDDNTLDLFKGDITGFEADRDDNPESDETSDIESALIDYQADDIELHDTPSDDAVTLQPEIADQAANQADDHTDDQADDFTPAINLNEIVDDVVKQLIPDLEQQLRFLVRQALEEKLPEEIIQKTVSDDTTRSDD